MDAKIKISSQGYRIPSSRAKWLIPLVLSSRRQSGKRVLDRKTYFKLCMESYELTGRRATLYEALSRLEREGFIRLYQAARTHKGTHRNLVIILSPDILAFKRELARAVGFSTWFDLYHAHIGNRRELREALVGTAPKDCSNNTESTRKREDLERFLRSQDKNNVPRTDVPASRYPDDAIASRGSAGGINSVPSTAGDRVDDSMTVPGRCDSALKNLHRSTKRLIRRYAVALHSPPTPPSKIKTEVGAISVNRVVRTQ